MIYPILRIRIAVIALLKMCPARILLLVNRRATRNRQNRPCKRPRSTPALHSPAVLTYLRGNLRGSVFSPASNRISSRVRAFSHDGSPTVPPLPVLRHSGSYDKSRKRISLPISSHDRNARGLRAFVAKVTDVTTVILHRRSSCTYRTARVTPVLFESLALCTLSENAMRR